MPPTTKKPMTAAEKARRQKQSQAALPPPNLGRGGSWKKGDAGIAPLELRLPSGATCLCLQPGIQELLSSGAIENLDVLTALVDKNLVQPAKKKQKQPNPIARETVMDIIELSDRVVTAVVVDPRVILAPMPQCKVCKWEGANLMDHKPADKHVIDLVPRDPEAYYTDGISLEDKMAIVTFAIGGTDDIAPFLGEAGEGVAAMAAVPGVEVSS